MGNTESVLSRYRYQFADPKVGDFDLSGTKVYKIDDEESAQAAKVFLQNAKILYVDCEGQYFGSSGQKLGTVQIATGLDYCLVFHITKYRKSLDFLKNLFESDNVQKVFHDCSGDSAVLFHERGIRLSCESVHDTQIAHKVIESQLNRTPIDRTTGSSLADLYLNYCGKRIPGNKRYNKKARQIPGENMWTHNTVLPDGMMKYCVVDALALCEIFNEQKRLFEKDSEYKKLIKKQLQRKIKDTEAYEAERCEQEQSFNWGLLAVGAAAAIGAAVFASQSADKNVKRENRDEQKKKDECIIS